MKHVEFMGLPGSGKTTLWRESISLLQKRGRLAMGLEEAFCHCLLERVVDKRLRIIKPLPYLIRKNLLRHYSRLTETEALAYNRFMIEHPELAYCVFTALDERPSSAAERTMVGNWVYRSFSRYDIVDRNLGPEETVVLDEGFCNRAMSLFADHETLLDPDMIHRYAKAIPLPDLVFAIETEPERCLTRLSKRESGFPPRIGDPTSEEKRTFLANVDRCLQTVRETIERDGVEVIEIDNDGSLEDSNTQLGLEIAERA